jgi:hypothetical protein
MPFHQYTCRVSRWRSHFGNQPRSILNTNLAHDPPPPRLQLWDKPPPGSKLSRDGRVNRIASLFSGSQHLLCWQEDARKQRPHFRTIPLHWYNDRIDRYRRSVIFSRLQDGINATISAELQIFIFMWKMILIIKRYLNGLRFLPLTHKITVKSCPVYYDFHRY